MQSQRQDDNPPRYIRKSLAPVFPSTFRLVSCQRDVVGDVGRNKKARVLRSRSWSCRVQAPNAL